jgi:lysophospholipase L1-like esterase
VPNCVFAVQGTGASACGIIAIGNFGNYQTNDQFASSSHLVDEVVYWPTAKYSANFTPPTTAYAGTEGMLALYHLDSSLVDSSTSSSSVTILPNNSAILYSPYNWLVTSAAAKTINPGAYLKTCFSGTSCTLNFNVTSNTTPVPQLWYSIDGQSLTLIETLGATQVLTMPTTTTSWALHSLLVIVKSTSEFVTRWTPQSAAVILTSISLSSGSTISVPQALSKNVLVYGDSIIEGYHTINANGSGTNDCDGSDATLAFSYMLGGLLGAEVGVVGFGGTGAAHAGQGGVPALTSSFNFLWSGQARVFSPVPDLIVIQIGSNDFANGVTEATFQAAIATLLTAIEAACPTSAIAILQPFEGYGSYITPANLALCTTAIKAAITASGNSKAVFVSTTGIFNATFPSSDGTHPLGVTTIASIAPSVSKLLQPILRQIRSFVFA